MKLSRKRRPPSTSRPSAAGPLVVLKGALFGRHRDDGDGAVVGGYRLVRGPDGKLIGYADRRR